MLKLVILFLMLTISNLANSQFNTQKYAIESDGQERNFRVYIPEDYSTYESYPLVFILHGGAGTASRIIKLTKGRFNQLAERDKFIAVYPDGYKNSWNDGARDTFGVARKVNINDVRFFEDMIHFLGNEFSIQKQNIFACGISNGGFMSQRLAYEMSDKIKGIAVVAANLSIVQAKKSPPENQISVLFMCGTADPLVPYNGGFVTVFNKKRGAIFSVPETVEHWKKLNSCSVKSVSMAFENKDERDNCTAFKTVWQNPDKKQIKVVDIKIKNGGHTWPGTKQYLPRRWVGNTNFDFNGCDEIWEFFRSLIKQ